MDTPEIGPEVKPKRKPYKKRTPYVGIEIRCGKKRLRGETVEITDRFLIVRNGRTSSYVALDGIFSFEVIDNRPEPTQIEITKAVQAAGPKVAGGPANWREGSDFPSPEQRNRELTALMGSFG